MEAEWANLQPGPWMKCPPGCLLCFLQLPAICYHGKPALTGVPPLYHSAVKTPLYCKTLKNHHLPLQARPPLSTCDSLQLFLREPRWSDAEDVQTMCWSRFEVDKKKRERTEDMTSRETKICADQYRFILLIGIHRHWALKRFMSKEKLWQIQIIITLFMKSSARSQTKYKWVVVDSIRFVPIYYILSFFLIQKILTSLQEGMQAFSVSFSTKIIHCTPFT